MTDDGFLSKYAFMELTEEVLAECEHFSYPMSSFLMPVMLQTHCPITRRTASYICFLLRKTNQKTLAKTKP